MSHQPIITKDAFSALEGAFHREIRGMLSKKQQGILMGKFREVLATNLPSVPLPDSDAIAQELVRAGCNQNVGTEVLADAVREFLQSRGYTTVTAEMVRRAEHYCPTDMPSYEKSEWKARHIRQAMTGPEFYEIPTFLRRDVDG